jgi:WD40 repeat protein
VVGRLQVWDEESGVLHRELDVSVLASFLSPDGQQPRLVAGSSVGDLRVYDPEAGSLLHHLYGHINPVFDLACIASSSAAPHHPRLVSTSSDCTAKVWDGETGECLADLEGHLRPVVMVAVWKEHTTGHDRIATRDSDGVLKVWDGEALTLLHDIDGGFQPRGLLAFESAEGPTRLLVACWYDPRGLQVWHPEEGRLLHEGINQGSQINQCHLLESAQDRHLLAIVGRGEEHPRHPGDTDTIRAFIDVWDLGDAPARDHVRGAHKHG